MFARDFEKIPNRSMKQNAVKTETIYGQPEYTNERAFSQYRDRTVPISPEPFAHPIPQNTMNNKTSRLLEAAKKAIGPSGIAICESCGKTSAECHSSFVILNCKHIACPQCLTALINSTSNDPPRPVECFVCQVPVTTFDKISKADLDFGRFFRDSDSPVSQTSISASSTEPFISNMTSMPWPIVRVDNIPWDITVKDVTEFLNSMKVKTIPFEQRPLAVHILCNFADGKTLNQCYIEMIDRTEAQKLLRERNLRILKRPISIILSNANEVMAQLYQHRYQANTGCDVMPIGEFQKLEKLFALNTIHTLKSPERAFMQLISVILTFPWDRKDAYSTSTVRAMSSAVESAINALKVSGAKFKKPDGHKKVLKTLVFTAFKYAHFPEYDKQKFYLLSISVINTIPYPVFTDTDRSVSADVKSKISEAKTKLLQNSRASSNSDATSRRSTPYHPVPSSEIDKTLPVLEKLSLVDDPFVGDLEMSDATYHWGPPAHRKTSRDLASPFERRLSQKSTAESDLMSSMWSYNHLDKEDDTPFYGTRPVMSAKMNKGATHGPRYSSGSSSISSGFGSLDGTYESEPSLFDDPFDLTIHKRSSTNNSLLSSGAFSFGTNTPQSGPSGINPHSVKPFLFSDEFPNVNAPSTIAQMENQGVLDLHPTERANNLDGIDLTQISNASGVNEDLIRKILKQGLDLVMQ